ncbi:hypothetical protein Emed_005703 [Eimeria media]
MALARRRRSESPEVSTSTLVHFKSEDRLDDDQPAKEISAGNYSLQRSAAAQASRWFLTAMLSLTVALTVAFLVQKCFHGLTPSADASSTLTGHQSIRRLSDGNPGQCVPGQQTKPEDGGQGSSAGATGGEPGSVPPTSPSKSRFKDNPFARQVLGRAAGRRAAALMAAQNSSASGPVVPGKGEAPGTSQQGQSSAEGASASDSTVKGPKPPQKIQEKQPTAGGSAVGPSERGGPSRGGEGGQRLRRLFAGAGDSDNSPPDSRQRSPIPQGTKKTTEGTRFTFPVKGAEGGKESPPESRAADNPVLMGPTESLSDFIAKGYPEDVVRHAKEKRKLEVWEHIVLAARDKFGGQSRQRGAGDDDVFE